MACDHVAISGLLDVDKNNVVIHYGILDCWVLTTATGYIRVEKVPMKCNCTMLVLH